MGAGPLIPKAPAPSWRLDARVAADTQGFAVTGFGDLPTGRAVFQEFRWSGGTPPDGWLKRLQDAAEITSAVPPGGPGAKPQTRAASIAFSATGLQRLGLAETCLSTFGRPFQEGMFQEDRLRRLGDRREGEWLDTVVKGGPAWSGNGSPSTRAQAEADDSDAASLDVPEDDVATSITVHALLLLYTQDEADAEAWLGQVEAAIRADGVTMVCSLELILDVKGKGKFSREHFGFADALSQPLRYDDVAVWVGDRKATTPDPVQGVPLGEFLFGYLNGHREKAPGPVVASDAARTAGLPASASAEGSFDLGLNGSYLVVRELKQDVAAFWRSMEANAVAMGARDPEGARHVTGDWLAERAVGRDRDGHLLRPRDAKLPACTDGSPDSSFLFHDSDPYGAGCPPGSHVRRAFPRDALTPREADRETLLRAANNHRILRRGRKFGSNLSKESVDDGLDRGLLFMCLNTDVERQFEFVQQTWLLNNSFATLFQEVDPLVGPAGRMTIRGGSVSCGVDVATFVRMVGGEYFFLPSLPALRYLSSL